MLKIYGCDILEDEFILRMWDACGKYTRSKEDIKKVNEGKLKIHKSGKSLKMSHAMINLLNVNDLQTYKIPESYKKINKSDIVIAKDTYRLSSRYRVYYCQYCGSLCNQYYMIRHAKTLWLFVDYNCLLKIIDGCCQLKLYYKQKYIKVQSYKLFLISTIIMSDIMSHIINYTKLLTFLFINISPIF